eukprot:jgi/Tetstr1/432977/TSEL_022314.t1
MGVNADIMHPNKEAERGPTKKVQKWNGAECWDVMGRIPHMLFMGVPMAHPKCELYLDCHGKFTRVIALWMIDGIAKGHWPMLRAATNMASQEWLRTFNRVASPQDVTPTMHTVVAHYGDPVADVGPMLGHCTEGMEHKHKPIKRDGREDANIRDFNSEYASRFTTSIYHAVRPPRLMSMHLVETHVPGGQSNKHSKWNTFTATAEWLNGAGPDDQITAYEVRTTYAGKPVMAKRDALLVEVARLHNEWLDKMNACGWNIDEA